MFHSFIITIAIYFSALLSSLGLVAVPVTPAPETSPTATTTEQVATTTPDIQEVAAPASSHTPVVVTVEATTTPTATTSVPVIVPTTTPATTTAPAVPPIVIQVQVPAEPAQTQAPVESPATGSNITSTTSQAVPMEPTYTITAPANAPQKTIDLLGDTSKTLAQLQTFVASLNPQLAFKKKMQSADIETLTAFLEQNGYTVEANQ